jgi:hypothetical protein
MNDTSQSPLKSHDCFLLFIETPIHYGGHASFVSKWHARLQQVSVSIKRLVWTEGRNNHRDLGLSWLSLICVKYYVLTAVAMKGAIFWNITWHIQANVNRWNIFPPFYGRKLRQESITKALARRARNLTIPFPMPSCLAFSSTLK